MKEALEQVVDLFRAPASVGCWCSMQYSWLGEQRQNFQREFVPRSAQGPRGDQHHSEEFKRTTQVCRQIPANQSSQISTLFLAPKGTGLTNSNAANPSNGTDFSLTDSNSLVNQCRRGSHDWLLKLLPTVIPITLPIMAPAANSENQWIVTETANPT